MDITALTCYLGIDIGGTKIAAGLVSGDGRVLRRAERPTPAQEGGASVLAAAVALAKGLCNDGQSIASIGVGAGGQIDATNGIVMSATDLLPGWAGVNIKHAFASAFSQAETPAPHPELKKLQAGTPATHPGLEITVAVDNDVNALAMGELRFGAAAGMSTVVFLALGTGVGGALLIDGKLHHGAHWTGGEFGHLLLSFAADARLDAAGDRGTFEAYASGPGLVQTWREITGDDDPGITGRAIADDALRDPGGTGALTISRTGEYLGYGLVSLANILDPNAIVIGGGLASLGDLLLDPARRILREQALPGPATCPVVAATLGADASVIGAASLAMRPTPPQGGDPPETGG